VRRVFGEIAGGAAVVETALGEYADVVRELKDGDEVVRDIDESEILFALNAAEETDGFGLGDGVERAGGFVGNENGWPMQKGERKDDALCLAYADLAGLAVEEGCVGRELKLIEKLGNA